MKKSFIFNLAISVLLFTAVPLIWAQDSATEEDTTKDKTKKEFILEEITVTAEKRAENVQKVPASVAVVSGDKLTSLGKFTTQEILDEIPGVDWISSKDLIGAGHAQPDAGIKIRGIARKLSSDGQPPSAVASYVDGVFEGMGANYDIERVEVLRGPQGTLYGRSATGGVVAFHTRDPELQVFGGNISLTTGSEELRNIEAAVNAPLGESFALRIAARYNEQDDFWTGQSGKEETKEARAKLLYQPTDRLRVMLTGQVRQYRYNGGGCSQTFYDLDPTDPTVMPDPDKYNYCFRSEASSYGNWNDMYQGTLNVEYDFGDSILTYIGSYRYYEDSDNEEGSYRTSSAWIFRDVTINPGEWFHTEELRWASNTDGKWKWLVGANYYYSRFDRYHAGIQHRVYDAEGNEVNPPYTYDAPLFAQTNVGHTYNIGFFTEHTYELRDDMRLTGGLRYDKSEVEGGIRIQFNINSDEFHNGFNPPIWVYVPPDGPYNQDQDFSNVTYKLRWEYDVTPDNMIYALTATGFLPGDVRLGLDLGTNPPAGTILPYDEEKLTTYEIGSKNRFFDNKLQFNMSAYYYDYEDYRNTVNINTSGQGASYVVVVTPLRMYGSEMEAIYLLTDKDRISLNMASINAKITGFPDIDLESGTLDSRYFMAYKYIPGTSPLTGFLRYVHTFFLSKGSYLEPRVTLRYTHGYYLSQIRQDVLAMGNAPYNWQDDYVTCDLAATWTSSDGMYSASAYVNNLFDEEYKVGVGIQTTTPKDNQVYLGNPRNYGVNFTVRF